MPYTDESRAKRRATAIRNYQLKYEGITEEQAEELMKQHFSNIGRKGGKNGSTGGFSYMSEHDPKRHSQLSAKGGTISRRRKQNESK